MLMIVCTFILIFLLTIVLGQLVSKLKQYILLSCHTVGSSSYNLNVFDMMRPRLETYCRKRTIGELLVKSYLSKAIADRVRTLTRQQVVRQNTSTLQNRKGSTKVLLVELMREVHGHQREIMMSAADRFTRQKFIVVLKTIKVFKLTTVSFLNQFFWQ